MTMRINTDQFRDGNYFKFRMSYNAEMDSDFYVDYKMRLNKDSNQMEGHSINSRDNQNFVRLVRVK